MQFQVARAGEKERTIGEKKRRKRNEEGFGPLLNLPCLECLEEEQNK